MKFKDNYKLSVIISFIVLTFLLYFLILPEIRIGKIGSSVCWTSVTGGPYEHSVTLDNSSTTKTFDQCVGVGFPLFSMPFAEYFNGWSVLISLALSFLITMTLWKIYDLLPKK